MPKLTQYVVCAATLLGVHVPAPASAQSPATERAVALAPLSTLGSQKARALRKLEGVVEKSLVQVPGLRIIRANEVTAAVNKSKQSRLRACDGDVSCLAELGQLVSAQEVVYGEVGGLGDVQVIYLKVIDVASGKELRSTTLELGGTENADDAARASAVRLLDPERYVGQLVLEVDASGSQIFVDGQQIGKAPSGPLPISVGSHALRVTHPEYRDFVRFVDIEFGSDTRVTVNLKKYPVVAHNMRKNPRAVPSAPPSDGGSRDQPVPWYRRWYTIAGGGALLFVTSVAISSALAGGIDADREKPIE